MTGALGEVGIQWASLSLGGLIVGLIASTITFWSAWLVTSRQLRDATRTERRRVYAAYLQAADAVWEAQFLVRRVFDRYEAFQGQLETAQTSDNPEVAVSGLQEELRVLKERADVRTDSADGYISTLNARFFEVELIAPEHLRAAAKVVKKAAQTNATVTVQGGEIERRQADDELNQAIRGFVIFARIDTDSPNAWVLPKYALWVARKRADSSLKKHRPEELHSPS